MSLYRCSDEHDNYPDYKDFKEKSKDYGDYMSDGNKKDNDGWFRHDDVKDYKKDMKKERCFDDCDSESAKALKKILSLLDELNIHDLHILDEIIERLLCSRKFYK